MKQVFQFLSDLKENNDRTWFHANKARYMEARAIYEEFTGRLIALLALADPEIEGVELKDCLFRIYRDTRFSKDKIPYKTHMGAFIARGGRMAARGGYYLHVEPGNSLFAGGIWCPDTPLLKALRQDIFDNVEEFEAILRAPGFAHRYALDEESKLQRVPAPFPADSPAAAWTKYKRYTAACGVPDDFFDGDDAVERCADRLLLLHPFNRFLNYTVDETMRPRDTEP
ncbi:MAG: DUF2461 domain-containing protein [Odoribacteraceae bacterium]|jgi:uncharacterized protein (TIGR02453 family)|nr:DUF2461 domain-containing protein [Odoribacteraceae bacterium]